MHTQARLAAPYNMTAPSSAALVVQESDTTANPLHLGLSPSTNTPHTQDICPPATVPQSAPNPTLVSDRRSIHPDRKPLRSLPDPACLAPGTPGG